MDNLNTYPTDLKIDYHLELALKSSVKASEILMQYYQNGYETKIKSDGSPVTDADLASSKIIRESLQETGIPIVDEESKIIPYKIRKNWSQNWCIDPLDGTKEFISGNGEFSVNIALIKEQKAIFGLIASPVKREILFGGINFGVYISTFENIDKPEKWTKIKPLAPDNSLHILSSRSHLTEDTKYFIAKLTEHFKTIENIKKGSALKFFDLVKYKNSIYARFGRTMEWDSAAGHAILSALNGKVISTSDKKELTYNKEELFNPSFYACSEAFYSNYFATNE